MTPTKPSSTSNPKNTIRELTQLLESPHEQIQREAIKNLGRMGPEAASTLPRLYEALKDPNFVIRLEAAIAIGFIGNKDQTGVLLPLLDDEIEAVRFQVISALAFIGDARATPELTKRYETETPHVKDQILRALGHLGGKQAYQLLERELKAENPTVRTGAVVGLSFFGDNRACPLLQEIADNDPDEIVAHEARIAILQLKSDRKLK